MLLNFEFLFNLIPLASIITSFGTNVNKRKKPNVPNATGKITCEPTWNIFAPFQKQSCVVRRRNGWKRLNRINDSKSNVAGSRPLGSLLLSPPLFIVGEFMMLPTELRFLRFLICL
ncbi:hypothetical protein T4B_1307 [Trichinella pseudospiralis]|uniref:Uncharacterized protein n=2 Tax=Trichinella pseudospiralis TaxID=6337 RepID=A0A0V1IF85_TRIPS|nr:hypothetical protein T4A_14458 [Trichinella pseudospiralis]KRY83479.1 hypothetical protein T4D_9840 [Trichinella pseudospiralis]KRZ21266.1 hypothetical protein T4B_1307 [Trichinella pseudospiralis]